MLFHSRDESVFKATPLPSLILYPPPHFTVADVNQAYLNATGITEKEIVDKALFEVFPETTENQPAGCITDVKQALRKVLATKAAVTIKGQNKLIWNTDTDEIDNLYQVFYLSPVLDEDKAIELIIFSILEIEQENPEAKAGKSNTNGVSAKINSAKPAPAELQKDKVLHSLQERIKEQSCLYKISNLDEQELSVDEL